MSECAITMTQPIIHSEPTKECKETRKSVFRLFIISSYKLVLLLKDKNIFIILFASFIADFVRSNIK